VQFHPLFTFADAAQLVPYLHALGISDCYSSPYFKAKPGSPHGYDVIDHNVLNPELGSEEDYDRFVYALRRQGMGHILDLVPNHMGIATNSNVWWADVLENGPSSLYAACFDIDWTPVKAELANKVLLPILGDQYGSILENQELTLSYDEGAFFLNYYDHRLPIAPRPSTVILFHRLGDLEHALGPEHPQLLEFRSIITALSHLPLRTETDRDKVIERHREKEIIKKRLATVMTATPEILTFVTDNVAFFNGKKGEPHSFDFLDGLLTDQAYRLAYWRTAADEINYRRFFDVNELAAVRTEDPLVFAATHQLVLRLCAARKITGLRIDHVDGLYDPAQYLWRLQQSLVLALHSEIYPEVPSPLVRADQVLTQLHTDAGPSLAQVPCYIVVEKILGEGESLPESWSIHGSTGYDFLADLNGIFVDADNEKLLTDIYKRFTRSQQDFATLVYENKKFILQVALSSELNVLGHQLNRLSERNRHARDFTLNSLTHALREIIACFPVYRTYISTEVSERDRAIVEQAVAYAKRKNPARDVSIFNYVRDVLLLRFPDGATEADRQAQRTFVMKFQQCTSPVMAKGVEDTAFYLYNRLVSLNEVGSSPDRFGTSLATFHTRCGERSEHWPHTLLATTTHDTKRSEDVRARINVLSELPDEWRTMLGRWGRQYKKRKTLLDGQLAPDRNDEYLFYQTVLGVWPLAAMTADDYTVFKQRIQAYMHKASKEAKVNTSWINPNQPYDDALREFVGRVLDDFLFRDDFQQFRTKIARYGMYNSLSQTVIKLTAPGIPDLYQGTELWDFSLVDPDNRRPVDYDRRRQLLLTLQSQVSAAGNNRLPLVRELLETWEDGRIKLYLTQQTLIYRREHPDLFRAGGYIPLEAIGQRQEHLCAFARRHGGKTLVVVAPRLLSQVVPDPMEPPLGTEVWAETWLALLPDSNDRPYQNFLTGERITPQLQGGRWCLSLGEILANFPVALLEGENQ
jgi:(1->4)-alpha-D-glucan 1-alpha-D-glucosylmutase